MRRCLHIATTARTRGSDLDQSGSDDAERGSIPLTDVPQRTCVGATMIASRVCTAADDAPVMADDSRQRTAQEQHANDKGANRHDAMSAGGFAQLQCGYWLLPVRPLRLQQPFAGLFASHASGGGNVWM